MAESKKPEEKKSASLKTERVRIATAEASRRKPKDADETILIFFISITPLCKVYAVIILYQDKVVKCQFKKNVTFVVLTKKTAGLLRVLEICDI